LKFRYGRQPAASTCATSGQTLAFYASDQEADPVLAEERVVLGARIGGVRQTVTRWSSLVLMINLELKNSADEESWRACPFCEVRAKGTRQQ
jgi:hypothetical protein